MRPAGWTDDENVIACGRQEDHPTPQRGARRAMCELCGAAVWAAPASIAKATEPHWRLICTQCLANVLPGEQVIFAGRYDTHSKRPPWEPH